MLLCFTFMSMFFVLFLLHISFCQHVLILTAIPRLCIFLLVWYLLAKPAALILYGLCPLRFVDVGSLKINHVYI
jgi:hypothetical protein